MQHRVSGTAELYAPNAFAFFLDHYIIGPDDHYREIFHSITFMEDMAVDHRHSIRRLRRPGDGMNTQAAVGEQWSVLVDIGRCALF
jgi:hypothetical protein